MVSCADQTFFVFALQTDNRHWPFYNTGFHILISRYRKRRFDLCSLHSKFIVTALKMLMCQNRTTYDRQIRIGTQEIMRELLYKS